VELRPLGLWNDTWRVYALGVLLVCFAVSLIFSGIVLWPLFREAKLEMVAMAIVASAAFALSTALCAGLAYWAIDAALRPLIRWVGLSLVNASVPVALVLLVLGESIALALQTVAPLVDLHAAWSGVFLSGRRARPPRKPLPRTPQLEPRGWDSRH
jgi:hypothetical protein